VFAARQTVSLHHAIHDMIVRTNLHRSHLHDRPALRQAGHGQCSLPVSETRSAQAHGEMADDARRDGCRWTSHSRWSSSRRSTATSAASRPGGWTASWRRCCPGVKPAGSRRACRSTCAAAARSGRPRTRACRSCSSAPAQASLPSGALLLVTVLPVFWVFDSAAGGL